MEHLGLHNKPKAEVHLGHKLTGPKEEEEPLHLKLELCRAEMAYSHRVEVLFLPLHFLNT
jgi:hypothetical protein